MFLLAQKKKKKKKSLFPQDCNGKQRAQRKYKQAAAKCKMELTGPGRTAYKCLNIGSKSLKKIIRMCSRCTCARSWSCFSFIKLSRCYMVSFGLQQTLKLLPPVHNGPVRWSAGSRVSAVPTGAATEAQRSIPVVLKGLKL